MNWGWDSDGSDKDKDWIYWAYSRESSPDIPFLNYQSLVK
jgi:hypothetical protein